MNKGIFCLIKGFFMWSCFCYLPFGFVIILSVCNQPIFDWRLFTLVTSIWLFVLVVCDREFEQFKKK